MNTKKYFSIDTIKHAILHLQHFDSNWIIVPLVFAVNGVKADISVDINKKKGGDAWLNHFFHGSLIGLDPFDNKVNSMRPRFSDIYPNMKSQNKADDFVYHQSTRLWSNVYSSRGYREMRMAGVISGELSCFKLEESFLDEWKTRLYKKYNDRLEEDFKFDQLLVWLYSFIGIPTRITSWEQLYNHFVDTEVDKGTLLSPYTCVFKLSNTVWPGNFLETKIANSVLQKELIPSIFDTIRASAEKKASATKPENEEEPEGVDVDSYDATTEYPIDDVLIRSETRSVYEIVRRINSGKFILDPDFQRDFIWDVSQQSKLVESTLLRIPLPVFYLAERKDGNVVVVDGLQRLTTFKRFLGNEFVLKGLEALNQLNGNTFDELPGNLPNRIEDTPLILYLIDYKAPERAKLDIFERVNSGVKLTRQQMRNCMFSGKATRWLKELAVCSEFLRATRNGLSSKTMRDRESINRFCGFYLLGVKAYRGDMDDFLARTLEQMNNMNDSDLDDLRAVFIRSMKNNYHIFGSNAFRKHYSTQENGKVVNIALFDIFSVLLADIEEETILGKTEKIRRDFYNLLNDTDFFDSITISTNSTKKLLHRFKCLTDLLAGL